MQTGTLGTIEKVQMGLSPFHALYKARELAAYAYGRDRFVPVFASSDLYVYPYQIAAAQFALRSPYLKGVILCDEGSLGKTYEALLVMVQLWYEGKDNILLFIPAPLLRQWIVVLERYFTVPYTLLDSKSAFEEQLAAGNTNPFVQEGLVLTTYDVAADNVHYIEQIQWDLAVFEEAHHLRRVYSGTNKKAAVIRDAVKNAFKLLLTATPLQNSIMDLYGLVSFIDATVFPDEDAFYQRYFRKPENYPELAERISRFCFRTTRQEVATYVKMPERIPITVEFDLTDEEQHLHKHLDAYVQRGKKIAFPKMDRYDLALMLLRAFSSSTPALERTLRGALQRLEQLAKDTMLPESTGQTTLPYSYTQLLAELDEVRCIHSLAANITINAKAKELLTALKKGFTQLKKLGAKQKALIFTENRITQNYLFHLLNNGAYKGKVLTYNGSCSRDYSIMERFAQDATILISTDVGAEGFNLEFCSFVINYDLPYNTMTIEQRINRCHRQGQQSDVIILNFLNRHNFADVRMLELINKRILQFSGIFGMSDTIIGNFGEDSAKQVDKALGNARSKSEIDHAYHDVLSKFEEENKGLVQQATQSLFTSFSKDVADKVRITPQYIEELSSKINEDLWALTKYFFANKPGFRFNDETRTVSCLAIPPKIFTGRRMGRNEYSMAKGYQPRSGRHTVTGSLAKAIIHEICWQGIHHHGNIIVDAPVNTLIEPCSIGFYQIRVNPKNNFWGGYLFYSFVGKIENGNILTHEECQTIMNLSVLRFSVHGTVYGEHNRHMATKQPHELDSLIDPDVFLHKALTENGTAEKEAIEQLTAETAAAKHQLERQLDGLRLTVKTTENLLAGACSRLEKLELQKKCAALRKELQQNEQNLFMNGLKMDMMLEENIKKYMEAAELTVAIDRQFVVQVKGDT